MNINFEREYITFIEKQSKQIFTKEYEQYISESRANLLVYNKLYNEYRLLNSTDKKQTFGIVNVYTVANVNQELLIEKQTVLKNILQKQKKMYNNFINHYQQVYKINLLQYKNYKNIEVDSDTSSIKSSKSSKSIFRINRDRDRDRDSDPDTVSKRSSLKQKKFFSIFKS